jgi:hypothetical protein
VRVFSCRCFIFALSNGFSAVEETAENFFQKILFNSYFL